MDISEKFLARVRDFKANTSKAEAKKKLKDFMVRRQFDKISFKKGQLSNVVFIDPLSTLITNKWKHVRQESLDNTTSFVASTKNNQEIKERTNARDSLFYQRECAYSKVINNIMSSKVDFGDSGIGFEHGNFKTYTSKINNLPS